MGPKAKKQPKNAFSFFLNDYVSNLRKQGCEISVKLAAEECGPIWKELPEAEKGKYKKLAAHNKVDSKEDKKNKFTCIGVSYAQLEEELEELRRKTEKADNEIKTTIFNLDCESLKDHLFYIIHCNYFCKTDEGLYIPGEIAISEFCLGDGVRRTFHTLIDPGAIPLGYAYDAKQTIDDIHGLPYPPYSEGNSDYSEIYEKILNFLEPGKLPDGRYPPLYCIENNIKASENILQLLSDSCSDREDVFRVYLLHKMFFSLKNKCVEFVEEENVGFPVLSVAENEISKDIFCFTPGISCAFHMNSEEKFHNCSLSVVQRFVFTICDHCCQHLEIDLIPGKHCRINSDVRKNLSFAMEKRPRRKPKTPSRPEESDFDRQSSFIDDASSFCWRRSQRGSFLHDEIESTFSSLEISSIVSSRRTPNVNAGSSVRSWVSESRGQNDELDELEKKLKRNLTLDQDDDDSN